MENPAASKDTLEALQLIVNEASDRGIDQFHPDVKKFCTSMKEKYPQDQLNKCALWHALIQSTPATSTESIDLPEGEIAKFIQEEMSSIKTEEE